MRVLKERHCLLPAAPEANDRSAQAWHRHMLAGDFEEAWRESDAIRHRCPNDPQRFWNGESFINKRVLIRCLHGFGDAIQFIRYASLLRKSATEVGVSAHPDLVTLLRTARGVDWVTTWKELGGVEAPCDCQVEVMELPYAFRTTLDTLPSSVPYLAAPAMHILLPLERPRIGVVWQSGPYDPQRSIPFHLFRVLFDVTGFTFVSLQFGYDAPITANLHVPPQPREVLDTAALMAHIDLVITVDTMAAHLAGALGLPVWLLLPPVSDWRWMLDRPDSPWYPSMRVFRSTAAGWSGVLEEVKDQLKGFKA